MKIYYENILSQLLQTHKGKLELLSHAVWIFFFKKKD